MSHIRFPLHVIIHLMDLGVFAVWYKPFSFIVSDLLIQVVQMQLQRRMQQLRIQQPMVVAKQYPIMAEEGVRSSRTS